MSYPKTKPHLQSSAGRGRFRGPLIWLVIVAALAGGCVFVAKNLSEPKVQPQIQVSAPPAKKAKIYTIRMSDKLSVSVENHHDLRTTGRVDSKGAISLPVALEVRVQGLTIPEAEAAIQAAYLKRLAIAGARVTVVIDEWSPREVTIGGQVRKPGRYALQIDSPKTMRDLLFTAGGGTETAKLQAVRLTRILPDGSSKTEIHDVDPAAHNRAPWVKDDSVIIEPDDIVYVPERII